MFGRCWREQEGPQKVTIQNPPIILDLILFPCHFVAYCSQLNNSRQVRKCLYENIKLVIIWKGSKISCNKFAQTNHCSLCLQEKKSIFHHVTKNRLDIMNSRSEIFGSCNCKTIFCQFVRKNLGTEEGVAPETV